MVKEIKIGNKIINNELNITDNTVNGQCSNCGECCTEFIPLTRKEIKNIKEYLKKNPGIENKRHEVGNNIHILCPFRDRETKKCNIYEVRPKVCREFICNLSNEELLKNKQKNITRAYYNNGLPNRNISLHSLFFNDVEWEMDVWINLINAKNAEDFMLKFKAMNPVLLNEKYIEIE